MYYTNCCCMSVYAMSLCMCVCEWWVVSSIARCLSHCVCLSVIGWLHSSPLLCCGWSCGSGEDAPGQRGKCRGSRQCEPPPAYHHILTTTHSYSRIHTYIYHLYMNISIGTQPVMRSGLCMDKCMYLFIHG